MPTGAPHPAPCPLINVLTTGDLQIYNTPTGTTVIAFHDWYSMDA
jgi:hypothetical protein